MKNILSVVFILSILQQTNSQSIGIGTNTPYSYAMLDVSSNSKGLLIPRMGSTQRALIPSIASSAGMIVFDTAFKEIYYNDGISWKKLLNSSFWNSSSSRNWIYNITDSVGIGTTSPDHKLHIVNGRIYLQDTRANQNPHIIFDNPNLDYKEGGLQWKRAGDTIATLNYVNNPNTPNYIQLKVGNASNLFFNENSRLGIGVVEPAANIHIRDANANDMIRLDGTNPEIRFTKRAGTGPGYTWDDIGFVQTTDGKDLRIGTYSGNINGKLIIRTDGVDRVHVTGTGMGIGTELPLTKLHLQSGADVGLTVNNNGYAMIGTAAAGAANMVIDNNEIMARNGYTAAGTLYLQNEGGELAIGAKTTINKDGQALVLNGVNPYMSFLQSGTQRGYIQQSGTTLFMGNNTGKIRIDADQVAIGGVLSTADNYKLAVTGKVICDELKVKLNSAWPDYVFNDNHKKPGIYELDNFIQQHRHLPNIPPAATLEKEGLEIGDMQRRMMEKIEELTLYIIDLQKQIDVLKNNQE